MGAVGGAGGAGGGGAVGGAGAAGAGVRGCGDGAVSAIESIRLKTSLGLPGTAELLVEGVGIPVCCMG